MKQLIALKPEKHFFQNLLHKGIWQRLSKTVWHYSIILEPVHFCGLKDHNALMQQRRFSLCFRNLKESTRYRCANYFEFKNRNIWLETIKITWKKLYCFDLDKTIKSSNVNLMSSNWVEAIPIGYSCKVQIFWEGIKIFFKSSTLF